MLYWAATSAGIRYLRLGPQNGPLELLTDETIQDLFEGDIPMAQYHGDLVIPRPAYLGGGNWELSRLNDVTVLFGKNGSGKSLLLRSLRDTEPDSFHYVAPERAGSLGVNPSFVQEEIDAQRRGSSSGRNSVPEYRRRVVSRVNSYFMIRGNHRGNKLPGCPEDIEDLLAKLVPDFTVALSPTQPSPYHIVRSDKEMVVANEDSLSSGEAQLLTVGLDIATIGAIWELESHSQRVLLVDEPDAHLHPDLQMRFAAFLFEVSQRYALQTLVATHSTTLLAALGQFGRSRTSVIYLDRRTRAFAAQEFSDVQKRLATCLGGHALMGPLFESPLLLVEGEDDYQIWSQVPRHHKVNLAVIPSGGEEIFKYQKSLEQIFASLKDPTDTPIGFALLDGDKRLPERNEDNRQEFIRFIRLACREAENLYLADEVLHDLKTTWDQAVCQIIAKASKYGEKASFLATAADWDRRNGDLKEYINEIAWTLDKKNVAWTLRIGQCLGRNRPVGQLAEFLGEDVVHALWGD